MSFWKSWKQDKVVPTVKKSAADSVARFGSASSASAGSTLDSLKGEDLPLAPRHNILVWAKTAPEATLLSVRLRPLAARFRFHFGTSAEEILRLAHSEGCDGVVVSVGSEKDPEIGFLKELAGIRPGAFRLVRCAERAHFQLIGKDTFTHQIPPNPDPSSWEPFLERCVLMRTWMETPGLKALLAKMKKLPALPNVYT